MAPGCRELEEGLELGAGWGALPGCAPVPPPSPDPGLDSRALRKSPGVAPLLSQMPIQVLIGVLVPMSRAASGLTSAARPLYNVPCPTPEAAAISAPGAVLSLAGPQRRVPGGPAPAESGDARLPVCLPGACPCDYHTKGSC